MYTYDPNASDTDVCDSVHYCPHCDTEIDNPHNYCAGCEENE